MNLSKYTVKTQAVLVASASVAKNYKHSAIEPEHLLSAMLRDKPVQNVLMKAGVKPEELAKVLEDLLTKAPKVPGEQYMGQRFVRLTTAAEALAGRAKAKKVEIGHLLLSFHDIDGMAPRLLNEAGATRENLESAFRVRAAPQPTVGADKSTGASTAVATEEKKSALSLYTVDLIAKAKDGLLGPVIGRTDEIRRVIQVLSRFMKNNPVLVGKPGVGKTAIVEALAIRIAAGDVPAPLKSKRILRLDIQSMLAGTGLRGQFEERMKELIAEVKAADGNIILFVDEIHSLVGAGGEGASDASQILKPELARGEIQILGSTTPDAYRNSIEKDKGLERRFQDIAVEEPTAEQALQILRGIKTRYEVHHSVRIQDPALVSAVQLSVRYLADRSLPDKAINLIDEAASRLRIEIDSVPDILDHKERELTHARMELRALSADNDRDTLATRQTLEIRIKDLDVEVGDMKKRWQREVELIKIIRTATEERVAALKELESAEKGGEVELASDIKYSALKMVEEQLSSATAELAELHKKGRLIKEEVEPRDIAVVIGDLTGIPSTSMIEGEKAKFAEMETRIGARVIGQKEPIQAIARAIRRSRAGLNDPNRPVGSFFFLGPTGVGKTELAKALSEFLFDNEGAMIRLDMSEFQEKHNIARLIGAPPGYKDADAGGQLTEAVRHKPYSVVLFDEVEKAHPDLFNILLQILDDGRLTDSQGHLVDFKNTVIVMTSNVGSRFLLDSTLKEGHVTTEAKDAAIDALRRQFRPEFIGRIDEVITFHGLTRDNIEQIADIHLRKIRKMVQARRLDLEVTPAAKSKLVDMGFEPAFGARPLRRSLQTNLQDPLSQAILDERFADGDIIVADVVDGNLTFEKKTQGI